ncbi:nucleoside deaminase [Candidatus Phytoplasma sp. AldY-WA1]|jgi:tRNA(adenine34) deaminase|uniref:nucleoside deaminase n=1 Tax=Candidatus Phytoplasma sp. AldY-WA1 TaxID=2852100 RepID=UPI00254FB2F7|nr:nucleoside deaminase [Candidatus Phytoplasma sp. AldY-WA1]
MKSKEFFYMKEAFKEAQKAFLKGEVPVGAVAVLNDKVIARAHNNVEKKKIFFGHAEFLILKKLNKKFKNYRFNDIIIYTTLEPCIMCMGALIQVRIKKIYYSTPNIRLGLKNNFSLNNLSLISKISFKSDFFEKESEYILKNFFINLRKEKKFF